MKNILFVRIPPPVSQMKPGIAVQWGMFSGQGQLQGDVHVSDLENLKDDWLKLFSENSETAANDSGEELLPDQVIVLLSGMMTVFKQLSISSGQKKHLNTALPYMMEEELAEDVDRLHISSYLDHKNDLVRVSAISHHEMQAVLEGFEKQGIPAQQVLSEQQLLPSESDSLLILPEAQSVMLSEPGRATLTLDYEALKLVIENWHEKSSDSLLQITDSNEHSQTIARAKVLFAEGEFPTPGEVREQLKSWLDEQGWLTEEKSLPDSVLEYFADTYFALRKSGKLVDLRHGPYKCPRRARRRMNRWKPLAFVAAIWAVLQVGLMTSEGILYGQKAEELWRESAELYLQVFPQDQQVKEALAIGGSTINVRSRMEGRLRSLSKKGGSGEEFLPLLQQISAIAASVQSAKVEPLSMDFNDVSGKLILDLKAESLQGIDQLVAAVKSSGLVARLDNASQGKAGASARVTIGRGE